MPHDHAQSRIRVTVWNENVHEVTESHVAARYPEGIHGALASAVTESLGPRARVTTATLDQPEHGLGEHALAQTDVLVWWGHKAHDRVHEEVVDRVQRHVLTGMGLVVLHSGHFARIFRRLMGTTCALTWRDSGERELVWTVAPGHPITTGVPNPIVIPAHETYGEHFDVPQPEELVFISSFTGGEVFRSGCLYRRGAGTVFYFSPGDQAYPVYHHPDVRRVIANSVAWIAPSQDRRDPPEPRHVPAGWFEVQRP